LRTTWTCCCSTDAAIARGSRHLLAAAEELSRRVRRVASGWEQELTLALDNVIPFARLIPLLDAFHRVAPTHLRITDEVLGGTWDALLSGRADIAVGAMQEGPEPSRLGAGYRSEPIGTVRFVFAVAPNHPLAAICASTGRSSSATPRSGWLRARRACLGWPTC
jgi:DNA-binding transcriptional LysR family regulator